jgi:transcriptional regulator of heat shock response
MLTQEDIQKIQQLLNEIQIKKDQLQQRKQNIEVDLKITEQQLTQLKEYFKNELGVDNIDEIEDKLLIIQKEIKEWIQKAQETLEEI